VFYLLHYGWEHELLVLPHVWQRNTFGEHDGSSNRLFAAAIKGWLNRQLGRELPEVKTQGKVEISEYELLDVDLADTELQRLHNLIIAMSKEMSPGPRIGDIEVKVARPMTSAPRLLYRMVDMVMCIASRGFSDELVQQSSESIASMVLRVFKNHLDYLPYVRTPTLLAANFFYPSQSVIVFDRMRNYHSMCKKYPIYIPLDNSGALNTLSKNVSNYLLEIPIIPPDVEQLMFIGMIRFSWLRGTYSVVEYNREINVQEKWTKMRRTYPELTHTPNLHYMLGNNMFFESEDRLIRSLGLEYEGGGFRPIQLTTYPILAQARVRVNGIEFTRNEMYIFRNTPMYDAVEFTKDQDISFPLVSLKDLRLYKRFLNGEIMLKHLYDNLSDTSFKVLSGNYSFLIYSELSNIRNMLDAHFILGMKFSDQIRLIKPRGQLEEQVIMLLT